MELKFLEKNQMRNIDYFTVIKELRIQSIYYNLND